MLPGILGLAGRFASEQVTYPNISGGSFHFDGNDYMQFDTPPVTDEPLTIMCWHNVDGTATEAIVTLDNSATNERIQLDKRVSGTKISATAINAAGTGGLGQAAATTSGWEHIVGRFTSDTSRDASAAGNFFVPNTTNIVVTGINKLMIGANYVNGVRGAFYHGYIAHVALWNIALSNADITSLAAKADPRNIQPDHLVFYAPLNTALATTDLVSGNPLTVSGPIFNATGP